MIKSVKIDNNPISKTNFLNKRNSEEYRFGNSTKLIFNKALLLSSVKLCVERWSTDYRDLTIQLERVKLNAVYSVSVFLCCPKNENIILYVFKCF
jgi:hypothetical protein